MRFVANYNFKVWASYFEKGKVYKVTDKETVDRLKSLESNPYGWPMFSTVPEPEDRQPKKTPKTIVAKSDDKEEDEDKGDEGDEDKKEVDEALVKLWNEYEKKIGKPVPVGYKNNKEWLEKKLAD